MWLRSYTRTSIRELRKRDDIKYLHSHKKKRKRARNQYCKTIKLMKNEKKASVLAAASQYYTNELKMYNDETSEPKKYKEKHNNLIKNNSEFSSDSHKLSLNQYGTSTTISYDLDSVNSDLNIRNSAISSDETFDSYGNNSGHFHTINTQYDFDRNYAKSPTEYAVSDLLLKSKLNIFFLQDYIRK